MIYGTGSYRFRVIEGWGCGPGAPTFGMTPSLAVDSRDQVVAFRRTPDPCVLVFDRAGQFLKSWGAGVFAEPHAIWVSASDRVYCTDREDHTVREFSSDGQLLRTFGQPHHIGAPGEPFNKPAKAIVLPDGNMWVADGYGQQRVHHFAPDGRLLRSWGEKGAGAGQLIFPHGVAIDHRGRVLIADREPNHRVSIFDQEGRPLDSWDGLLQPMDIALDGAGNIFVGEAHQRISIFSPDGTLLARFGEKGEAAGQFMSFIHGIWVDTHGDLYVADERRVQKFERI